MPTDKNKQQSKPGARQSSNGFIQKLRNAPLLTAITILVLLISLFVVFGDLPLELPSTGSQTSTECGYPLKTIEDWHIRTFRPKWFGLFGDPRRIKYRTNSRKARQFSVVDLDRRDIEIRLWVDKEDRGHNAVELDPGVNCGDDVRKCLEMGFGSALVLVPPGRHTVSAEVVKRKWHTPI
ncbi:hypothetical protein AX15_005459 [Amanita polypyramis BW_CC]|nr:hypothetical protein AX15_005459 [Amanita polypyramis BW_CC]